MTIIITRTPAANEAMEQQTALYQARCEMAPNAADLKAVVQQRFEKRWGFGTVEYDRAERADAAVRLQAVAEWELRNWREALYCLFAITYGHVSHRMGKLVELCIRAKRLSEAATTLEAFRIAIPERSDASLDYFEKVVTEGMSAIFAGFPPLQHLRGVAVLAGLHAENSMYEYEPSMPGHRRIAQWLELDSALAKAKTSFDASAAADVLRYWAGLANQKGEDVSFPEKLDRESILSWARAELAAAAEEEDNPPDAFVQEDREGAPTLFFGWDGVWTKGRNVRFGVYFGESGEVETIEFGWDSATGEPSRFLEIESLLTLTGCRFRENFSTDTNTSVEE